MAIDASKLVAFIKAGISMYPPPHPIPMPVSYDPPLPPGLDDEDVDEIREELQDDMSEAAQMKRKLSSFVGYMELSQPAGAFSCGGCKYATKEGICLNVEVRAPVSPEYGCCNLFHPEDESLVQFPPEPPKDEE